MPPLLLQVQTASGYELFPEARLPAGHCSAPNARQTEVETMW